MVLLEENAPFRQSTCFMDVSQRSFQGDVSLGKVSGKQNIVSELEGEKTDKNQDFKVA